MSDKDRQNIALTYPGRDDGTHICINVAPIYDMKYNMLNAEMFKKVNLQEPDKREEVIDAAGFTGIFNRKKKHLEPVTLLEFFKEI